MNAGAVFLMLSLVTFPVLADGHALFKTKCALCHGADGSGKTPTGKAMRVKDLGSTDVQKKSDAELLDIIAEGRGKMPAYKTRLTAGQLDELVKVVRAMKK